MKQLEEKTTPEIRSTQDLIYKLLKTDWTKIPEVQLKELLDYFCEIPESLLDHKTLRKRITKVLGERQELIPETHLERVRDFLLKVTVIDARVDFYSYVKLVSEVVIPNKYRDGRHIQLICESLQELYESYVNYELDPKLNKTGRLQVFLPPRSMKSVLCSILFPSWILGRNPKYRVLLIGNNTMNAIDIFGRPLKNLMLSKEYREIFPDTNLDTNASAAQRFFTTQGGGFYCSGGSVAIAGRGGDFIIADDLLSEQTAFSKVERTKINNNYIPGIRSRSQPGAAELIINTRWHLDDLSGFLLKADSTSRRPWKVISVPAILDEASVVLLKRKGDNDNKFVLGGSYWPEYKPIEELLDLKEGFGKTEPWKWFALYMQNPVAEEGNIVKAKDFKTWTDMEKFPVVSQVIVSMDTGYSEKERADPSAYTVWGVFHQRSETINGVQLIPNVILLYAEQGKWNFNELCNKCEDLRDDQNFKPDFFIIEEKASGIVLCQELHRRGFPLIEYNPRGKKEERLQAASVLIKAGRVWLPAGEDWAQEVKDQVCNFPSAAHDDLTDTVSMMVIWMRDNGVIRHESYDYEDPDEDKEKSRYRGTTYWTAAAKAL